MTSTRGLRDLAVIVAGLCAVALIIGWSFFRSLRNGEPHSLPTTDTTDSEASAPFRKLSESDLKKIILGGSGENTDHLIVDIRPQSLWSEEHIIGSKNFPIEEAGKSFQIGEREAAASWIIVAPDTASAKRFFLLLRTRGVPEEKIAAFDGTHESWKKNTGLVIRRADPTSPLDITKVRLLSPESAKQKIAEGGQWFILDIRSPQKFSEGHIAGATNIPFADLEANRRRIPPSASTLVYGENDRESFAGGVILFDLGFFNAFTLSSGFDLWKSVNLPVSSSP